MVTRINLPGRGMLVAVGVSGGSVGLTVPPGAGVSPVIGVGLVVQAASIRRTNATSRNCCNLFIHSPVQPEPALGGRFSGSRIEVGVL